MNTNREFFETPNTEGTVILADDEFFNQQSMYLKFKELDIKHRLQLCQNGREVISLINEEVEKAKNKIAANEIQQKFVQPISLLLLDINMPIVNGLEVCKKVKTIY